MTEMNELLKLCDDSRLEGAIQELGQLRKRSACWYKVEMENIKLKIEIAELQRSQMQPAVKFLGNSIEIQFQKVISEMEEVINELNSLIDDKDETARPRSLDECNDWQVAIETLKAIIEPDEYKRRESMIKTIAKNSVRDYYREDARD